MQLTVFGANGPTGRIVTQFALDGGHTVVAFTRKPERFPLTHERLQVVGGDVHDAAAVQRAIDGAGAVISTLGVPFAKSPVDTYSVGIVNIIAGMNATAGGERLVCVTSSTIDPYPGRLGGFLFEKVMQPYIVGKLGKTLYDDMRRMEAMVRASDLAWTIVRPSGLFSAEAVSAYETSPDHIGHRFTSRIDLADCLLRQATSPTEGDIRSAIAVATTASEPSMLKLIWTEGIRKKA